MFSYFEKYVREVLCELVEFHGGMEQIKESSYVRASRFMTAAPPSVTQSRKKLQDRFDNQRIGQYQKYGRLLSKEGFSFPTDLFSHFGIVQLLPKIDKKKGLRAFEIPSILSECLLMPLSKQEVERFEKIREVRNKIGHGHTASVTLRASLNAAKDLHALASKTDSHIREHFLIVQRYT